MNVSILLLNSAVNAEATEALNYLDGTIDRCHLWRAREMVKGVLEGRLYRSDLDSMVKHSSNVLAKATAIAKCN